MVVFASGTVSNYFTPGKPSLKRARTEQELGSEETSRIGPNILTASANIARSESPRSDNQSVIMKSRAAVTPIEQSRLAFMGRATSPNRYRSEPGPSRRRMRFDGVEVPTYRQIAGRHRNDDVLSVLSQHTSVAQTPSEDWEPEMSVSVLPDGNDSGTY